MMLIKLPHNCVFELSIVLFHIFYNITECCFVTVVSEVFTLKVLICAFV